MELIDKTLLDEVCAEAVQNPRLRKNYNFHIGQWHTVEVLEPDTVIFETKDGPYAPLADEDMMKI